MIEIICGVYGGKDGMKRPGDKPFSLSPAEEARLVARKVARYVEQPKQVDAEAEAEADAELTDYEADGAPIGFDETPPEDFDEADAVEEIVDLKSLTAKELRKIGKEYGLTFKANDKKETMIEAIVAAQAELADGEDAPVFDAAEAVE